MNNGHFTIHRRAQAAIDVLTPTERKAVRAKLAELAHSPIEQWSARGVLRISPQEPLYLARIDESLRAIVHGVAGQPPQLLDLVRHETLQWFRTAEDATYA